MNPQPEPSPTHRRISRAAVAPLIALLIGYISVRGPMLWAEYHGLRSDWETDVHKRVIGFPGFALAALILSINLVGDWLRDALNPKLQ